MGTLILLTPGIKEKLMETKLIRGMFTCHSILDQNTCHEVLSYEIVQRTFLAVALYHFFLTCSLLPNLHEFRERLHNHCWIFKLIIFTVFHVGTFSISQQNYFILYSSHIALVGGSLFIVCQFLLFVDFAEDLMELTITKQDQDSRTLPSRIIKFLIALTSINLLAFSFCVVIYLLVTTSSVDCTWSDIFIALNLGACFIAFAISLHPRIRPEIQPAVIFLPCALTTFLSVVLLIIALPAQENRGCSLNAAFLSAENLLIGVNFRVVVASLVMHAVLFYECSRSEYNSFMLGLLTDPIIDDCQHEAEAVRHNASPYMYSAFHFVMSTASLYTLTTITNWYGPVTSRFSTRGELVLIGLQAHWKAAEIVTTVACCVPIVVYISIMIYAISGRKEIPAIGRPGILEGQGIQSQGSMPGSFTRTGFNGSSLKVSNIDDCSVYETSFAEACKILKSEYGFEEKHDVSSQDQTANWTVKCRKIQNTSMNFYHFPREISQSFYGGRNGSNACTIIAVMIAKGFCCSDLEPRQTGNLNETWINLFSSCIAEGNRLYDQLINRKQQGTIYLSVEDVFEELGDELRVRNLGCSLPVSFVSETETATILFQLERLRKDNQRMAVIFIKDSRSGVFLFDQDSPLLFVDSHPYGAGGALLVCAFSVSELVLLLAEILHMSSLENLGSLTPVYFH